VLVRLEKHHGVVWVFEDVGTGGRTVSIGIELNREKWQKGKTAKNRNYISNTK
jgi:hypothetical protein